MDSKQLHAHLAAASISIAGFIECADFHEKLKVTALSLQYEPLPAPSLVAAALTTPAQHVWW